MKFLKKLTLDFMSQFFFTNRIHSYLDTRGPAERPPRPQQLKSSQHASGDDDRHSNGHGTPARIMLFFKGQITVGSFQHMKRSRVPCITCKLGDAVCAACSWKNYYKRTVEFIWFVCGQEATFILPFSTSNTAKKLKARENFSKKQM